jgi:hypothetical protein
MPGDPQGKVGAHFELMTTTPAGQWNSYDFTVVGDRATMMVNGKTIQDGTQIPKLAESGPIGLWYDYPGQRRPSGRTVQFRNILIRKLPRKVE